MISGSRYSGGTRSSGTVCILGDIGKSSFARFPFSRVGGAGWGCNAQKVLDYSRRHHTTTKNCPTRSEWMAQFGYSRRIQLVNRTLSWTNQYFEKYKWTISMGQGGASPVFEHSMERTGGGLSGTAVTASEARGGGSSSAVTADSRPPGASRTLPKSWYDLERFSTKFQKK